MSEIFSWYQLSQVFQDKRLLNGLLLIFAVDSKTKPALTRVQKPMPALSFVPRDLGLLTPKQMDFQDLS